MTAACAVTTMPMAVPLSLQVFADRLDDKEDDRPRHDRQS